MKLLLTLILLMFSMIAFSQDSSKTVTKIKYPVTGIDQYGTKIVTITQEQQKYINLELISLQQCYNREMDKAKLIEVMDAQLDSYKQLSQETDTMLNKVTLMLENRQAKIDEQMAQINLHLQKAELLEKQLVKQKRQILGWKIGTGVAIGVTVISIPLIIGLTL